VHCTVPLGLARARHRARAPVSLLGAAATVATAAAGWLIDRRSLSTADRDDLSGMTSCR
jgi:hypothetical protein